MFTTKRALDFNQADLKLLVIQTAACIIAICDQREPLTDKIAGSKDVVQRALWQHLNWDEHSYINALQAQVSLVYDFVKMTVDDPEPCLTLEISEVSIIIAALGSYQAWKTAHFVGTNAKLGPKYEGFGESAAFNRMDWTDLNDKLVNL
jgi:hypothetical protein